MSHNAIVDSSSCFLMMHLPEKHRAAKLFHIFTHFSLVIQIQVTIFLQHSPDSPKATTDHLMVHFGKNPLFCDPTAPNF